MIRTPLQRTFKASVAGLVLCAATALQANATVTPSMAGPGGSSTTSCGDTVMLSAVKKYEFPDSGFIGHDFKVVGVDLSKWLGSAGVGTMELTVFDDLTSSPNHHTYNASGQSGARTPVLSVLAKNKSSKPFVDVEIHKSSGAVACFEKLTF
jgi:hypothetical protein